MAGPGWTYNPTTHNYHLHGRFVKFDRIIEMAYAYAAASGDVVAGLASQVATGALRVDHWQALMRQVVKNQYVNQYLMGRGGLGQMTQRDWGIIGRQLRDQYHYLDAFAADVAGGRLTEGQIRVRAQMYIDAAHEAFERGRAEAFGLPLLPAYPADGQTQCLTHCQCNWVIEEVRVGGKLTGWRATWRLNPADHCGDCPVNAEIWRPLWVPAGMNKREADAWRRAEIEKMLAARGMTTVDVALGGPGSGHWGHQGRPGQVGGSAPGHAVAQTLDEALAQHISQKSVLEHIICTNPPDQVRRGAMTVEAWADAYMGESKDGYALMRMHPRSALLPVRAGDMSKVADYADLTSDPPPIVLDNNRKIQARFGGGRLDQAYGAQPYTVIDGKHRVEAALQRGLDSMRAYVPAENVRAVWSSSHAIEVEEYALAYFKSKGYPVIARSDAGFVVDRWGTAKQYTMAGIERIARNLGHGWTWGEPKLLSQSDIDLGGPGSGHWGHKGRSGQVGGSAPGGGRIHNKAGYLAARRKALEARSPRVQLAAAIVEARPDLDAAGVTMMVDIMTLSSKHFDNYAKQLGLELPEGLKYQIFGAMQSEEREMARLRWELEEQATWKDSAGQVHTYMFGSDAFNARPLVGNSIAEARAKLREAYGVTLDAVGAKAADVHRQISDLLGVAGENEAVAGLLRGVKRIQYVHPDPRSPHRNATADYDAATRTLRVFIGNIPPIASTWVHELGHALERYARDVPRIFGEGRTASMYAHQNYSEDFAETFTACVLGYDMADWLGAKWAAVEDAIGRIP